jgi:polyisoprenoid-binding protein YceI
LKKGYFGGTSMAKWIIDPDHSVASFGVRHMMVANVRGQFNRLSGTIYFDSDDMANSSVEVAIDVSGIYTGIQKRDDHLRSPDFLNVERYPQITFKSTHIETAREKGFRVKGDLSIHGISHPVTLDAEWTGPEKSPYGETSMGFFATVRINREDYGMTWNVLLESGGVMVGKEVMIILDIEADLTE